MIFINCWFPERVCSIKTVLVAIHKKERHEVAFVGRNLALGLHSSGRLSPFMVAGKRYSCFLPLTKPGSL